MMTSMIPFRPLRRALPVMLLVLLTGGCALDLLDGILGGGWSNGRTEAGDGGDASVAPQFPGGEAARVEVELTSRILLNESAYIPPQCYTDTRGPGGEVYNPCYTCHTEPRRPNFVNDSDLQLGYPFPRAAETNPWSNLFVDRGDAIAGISDEEILAYIRRSNYRDGERLLLAERLRELPEDWDYHADGHWDGYVPDAWFDFDDQGFDRDPAGEPTGWRAFAYYPFPGTFWPTNGSTGDVLIRLPEVFRLDAQGVYDARIYRLNLAVVEALIREEDVAIEAVDEATLGGVDLDKDGRIGVAEFVAYDWAPLDGRFMSYVGRAREEQQAGRVHASAGLFPVGSEFLHSVRYIDFDEQGDNRLAARMKELRYARKRYRMTYSQLQDAADADFKERRDFPDRLRATRGNPEEGVSNGQGWIYQGFIEDVDGGLRPQTFEEHAFCVGCHGGVGATRDGIFSFPRKLRAGSGRQDWRHWSQGGLRGMPEPVRGDGEYEYSFYLATNGAGDEFRGNDEVLERFFDRNGAMRQAALEELHGDIATLLFASPERALKLNKAYLDLVRSQGYIHGRDSVIAPAQNVLRHADEEVETGVHAPIVGY